MASVGPPDPVYLYKKGLLARADAEYWRVKLSQEADRQTNFVEARAHQVKDGIDALLSQDAALVEYIEGVARPIKRLEIRMCETGVRRSLLIDELAEHFAEEDDSLSSSPEKALTLSRQFQEIDECYRQVKAEYHSLQATRPLAPISYYKLKELVSEWNNQLRLSCNCCGEGVYFDELGEMIPHPEECGIF